MKEMRKIARDNGLTFKPQNMRINNGQAYMFVNRKTGEKILSNCTFWGAYESCMSGAVQTLAEKWVK